MKPLATVIKGRGEVNDFTYTKVKEEKNVAYIYKAQLTDKESENLLPPKHYEVFKYRENTQFDNVSYPSSKQFGISAWTALDMKRALVIFDRLCDEHKSGLDDDANTNSTVPVV